MEFHMSDESPLSLVEMRFHVPHSNVPALDGNQDQESPALDPGPDPVKELHDKILAKADVIQAIGDAIVTFSEIHCLTPRLGITLLCGCLNKFTTVGGDIPSKCTQVFSSFMGKLLITRFLINLC